MSSLIGGRTTGKAQGTGHENKRLGSHHPTNDRVVQSRTQGIGQTKRLEGLAGKARSRAAPLATVSNRPDRARGEEKTQQRRIEAREPHSTRRLMRRIPLATPSNSIRRLPIDSSSADHVGDRFNRGTSHPFTKIGSGFLLNRNSS